MTNKISDSRKKYLITGAAGFISLYLSKKLLDQGCYVIGIDNLNDYYDVNLKHARLEQLEPYEKFTFVKGDISYKEGLMDIFAEYRPDNVVNLAAQAVVRFLLEELDVHVESYEIYCYKIIEMVP